MQIGPSKNSVEQNATTDDPFAFKYFQDHENGTGSYMLSNWRRDVRLEFTKFADYWYGWEGIHADKHVSSIVKDYGTARLMVEKGDLDTFWPQDPSMVAEMMKNPDITVRQTPSFKNLLVPDKCEQTSY